MKNNNIKIAIIEEGNFYSNLIETQILDLCDKMNYVKLNWVIKSFESYEALLKVPKSGFQAIVLNNYSNRNNNQTEPNDKNIFNQLKLTNKDCMFISISGYREMLVTAELYKDGEMCFYYLKQSNLKNMNFEESCSIPSLYKLLTKLLGYIKEESDHEVSQKRISGKLKKSA